MDEIKPGQSNRDDMSNEKVTDEPISQQVNCSEQRSGQTAIKRGTLITMQDEKLDLINKAEMSTGQRTYTVKHALGAASQVDTDRLANDGVFIGDDTTPEKDYNLSSPEERDSAILREMSSPIKRDLLQSIQNEVKKDLSSAVGTEIKKNNVKHKQVLTDEERARRQRLHKSLQNLKPQLSSHKHHPVAPCTSVLFHEVTCHLEGVT